jgi:hypothetical protein
VQGRPAHGKPAAVVEAFGEMALIQFNYFCELRKFGRGGSAAAQRITAA